MAVLYLLSYQKVTCNVLKYSKFSDLQLSIFFCNFARDFASFDAST